MTPLISRLSVLTVTRKRSRRSRSIGCSSIDATAPVWTFDVGHISSGTRWSRTYVARRPSVTCPSSPMRDVVDDAHAVAQPLGAAPLERLPDGRQAKRLTGVDRQMEVRLVNEVEGVQVARRRVAGLGTGHVEAHDAVVAIADGELCDLDRARELAHRGDDEAHLDAASRARRGRSRAGSPALSRRGVRPSRVLSSGA